ncbi:hypothetical protein PtrSN002B_007672 [Pyrenophora tritici-repentis]|uniref:DUF1868 domain-containing protein n=2 Tax=Pyrenophora tritici-repentis TaxID=45151 RepID=A0A2W1FX65_9PLEO|nr:uncharacterized protein PTRG_08252 [Pyrenophora tritici-repentis Pt-1C-BFP]KAA8615811.1 hypothetical protein PtrV1_11207 [Pyrenophora tritici-repentis]EDU51171.1 conserved hypothetical protein [Pyrenophora tritici-repentis Pt-1C-BFP]KAF7566687.1 hypothetical protein PtrM4_150070 [Pyrenophora tritici-repentis]KAI0577867.1 hypothetical protein Alg215_06678 [Pyrenophora tritici-repentis]KAI0581777.1 hypothetical protein Alg130_06431 [Pyrenophora tritici-repentis]
MTIATKKFEFPALTAGPPSRRNWYKELLDDPGCRGRPIKVREAYESHRESFYAKQVQLFAVAVSNPVTPDQALIKYLEKQKRQPNIDDVENDLASQDVNCSVIWARPPRNILDLIMSLQKQILDLVGADLYIMPSQNLHLSVIELSHRHPVSHLRAVVEEISLDRIQSMLNACGASPTSKHRPKLVFPQINIDNMGIALSFVPSSDQIYTYHHLRADLHTQALESGISIDMCYTAPSAHITLGRFVGNEYFKKDEGRKEFLRFIGKLNANLKEFQDEWAVGKKEGLELQSGYLKFGRQKEKADVIGTC